MTATKTPGKTLAERRAAWKKELKRLAEANPDGVRAKRVKAKLRQLDRARVAPPPPGAGTSAARRRQCVGRV